jgi:uncharacterized protein (DUF1800 family)
MAIDPNNTHAALMFHRFGFGPRPDGTAAIATDPRGALLAELDQPGAGRLLDPHLLTSGEAGRAAFEFRQERRAARRAARDDPPSHVAGIPM